MATNQRSQLMWHGDIAVQGDLERIRRGDHHRLGMDPMPIAGSTAELLTGAPS